MAMGTRTRKDMVLPFLDFCNYTANMTSDGQADNPLLKRRLQSDTDRTKSLEQFYSLLVDESFCLVLIRTLEDQKKMTPDHKATVGCLLTIILEKERHMLYLTELLKVLLAETAVKANKTRKTRSLLKRNDSIMEKLLTNWFAMTLYTFTKVCMGESVFMMYNAVHGQHNKETENEMKPTDAVKESVGTVFKECLIVARQQNPVFPAPIKYMFDFMDSLAVKNGIGDRNVAKIWKCDSLHLRLFAKILKRPQSMLDISISRAVGRELDRISQAFIEICSDTKDTPTADLYVENIEHFRKKLRTYIEEVKALPTINDATLKQYLDEIYQDLSDSFDRMFALDELFYFYIGFKDEIGTALEMDEHCRKAGYAAIMDRLIASMTENQYEQIPSNYVSLYANPLVHYESLHHMSNEEDYQDLQLESEPFYSALDNDQQRLPEASSVQPHSEYQTVQAEPPSQYTTLQSGQQQKREGDLETEGSVYQPLQMQDNPSQYETLGITANNGNNNGIILKYCFQLTVV
ncbi:plexin-A1-like [Ptychodera flava]|uniref:plexin-A1-like n=1 Tax=Ptychodera flava TaxID=63121 RepID=UPI00396A7B3E